ncbi:acylneuraminate cytidylyltransferase family protein [Clostridium aestuarii]|uniref:Acylneuraminate cytidylyltransferase family protein n=1 Tax=Clostridium aestuarii TaxID=338193 RepID=A0ABT4CXF8_9CLOT|nr:acylneuraminate cytidylyltransferase family protein [Clostridium aestuarii]MCY6483671.1 acylneuraminate cytidylyltransferase family protein [Clostridium aestuarii]
MDKKIVALLPIKTYSERVKKKNFREFCGKPLYTWVLDKLLKSKYISKIVIDTDSKYLLEILDKKDDKIFLIERPDNLRGGLVPMNQIIHYDILQCEEKCFLQTHCTNPLLSTETIDKTIETYFNNLLEYDSLFTVNKIQKRLYNINLQPINHNPNELLRTQDLEPIYEENSNIFIFSKASFENNNNNRIGKKPYLFEQNYLESLDIDTEEDFIIAESVYQSTSINFEC